MSQSLLTLKVRKPTADQVSRAKTFLATEDEKQLPTRAKPYAAWTLMLDEHAGEEELVLQAVRVGEVGITAIPCEVFVESGLSLKFAPSDLPFSDLTASEREIMGHNASCDDTDIAELQALFKSSDLADLDNL